MREIKFRAWSESLGALSKPFTLPHILLDFTNEKGLGVIKSLTDERVIQYTGLKDKSGAEIYEGDIFKSENHNPLNFQVEFVEGAWCATSPYVKDYPTEMYHFSLESIEVISNIHENPELLEVESDD